MLKLVKWGLIAGTVVVGAGVLVFGTDLFSYAKTSGRMLKGAVRDAVPTEMEIQRARCLLEDLVPEMQANLKLVAQEEVEVASLEKEIASKKEALAVEKGLIQKKRSELNVRLASLGDGRDRKDLIDDLSRRFDRFQENEMLLASQEKLLASRKNALQAAARKLQNTRVARIDLAARIQDLEAKFRLLQAQGASSPFRIDDSKLAQTERLLKDLRKRLDVAQRVLEKEAEFADVPAAEPAVTADKLVQDIDAHFRSPVPEAPPAIAGAGSGPSF